VPQKLIKQNFSANWLLSAIRYGLYACLLMPLIFSGRFIFPYIFPKQAFFQIIVEIIMALYIFLALRQPEYRPRSSLIFKVLLAYFCVLVLSSVFGFNAYHSFWSNYERMAGVISLFHYLGFLFVAFNVFKTKEDWFGFFNVSIIASVLEAFYGLGQIMGFSSFMHAGSDNRIDGTIGNSSFLAGYMLINALFAFWLLLERKRVYWRFFYIATIFLNLFILYKTQTRGAVLALAFSLLILPLFFIFAPAKELASLPMKRPERLKKYAIIALVAFFVVVGIVWLARDTQLIKGNPTLARITHISISEGTGQTRLLSWGMALEGFLERPIFGWGPENFNLLFNKYYNPRLYPTESWFDRSHNAFLDVLVNTGIIGFTLYLSVFALGLWFLWGAWKKKKINYQTAVIFTVILVAYAIQNFFVFDTQITLLMIYLILAYLVYLSLKDRQPNDSGKPVRTNILFAIIIGAVFFSFFYWFNFKPGLAGTTGIEAVKYLQLSQPAKAAEQFKTAYGMGTFGLPEIASRAQEAAVGYLSSGQELDENKRGIVLLAGEGLEKSLAEYEPTNVRYMLMLVNIYLMSAQNDPTSLSQADAWLEKAVELGPTRQDVYFALAQLRLQEGRKDEVLAALKKAAELNPAAETPHFNYGLMAIVLGEKELGQEELKKAGSEMRNVANLQKLISIYTQNKDWPEAISLHQNWIKLRPASAEPYASLAALYVEMGDKQKAKEAALEAARVDPTTQAQVDEFIKGLGI